MQPSRASAGESARASGSGERRLDRLALLFAVLALAAAAASRGLLPAAVLPACAGPALLLGSALPLLARWSPGASDPLKLAVLTLALSPAFAAAVWGAWLLVVGGGGVGGANGAFTAAALTCAGLHAASWGRTVRVVARSRAEFVVGALAILLAAGTAFLLLRGSEPRLAAPGIERACVAAAFERGLPLEHPWFAGEAWPRAFGGDLAAAFAARALAVAPTLAHAVFTVLAALLVPFCLYLLGTSLWGDARRGLLGVLFALGACRFSLAADVPAHSVLATFLAPGPSAYALALSLAALYCATHALRRGARPWVGLCGVFHGAALALDFASAWPAMLATAVAALAPAARSGPEPRTAARPRVLLALALGALPGLIQARRLEPALAAGPLGAPSEAWTGAWLGALPWVALALAAVLAARRTLAAERRCVLVLALATAASGLAAASLGGRWTNGPAAWTLALVALGWLAAGLLEAPARAASALRRLATAAALLLVLLGPWTARADLAAAHASSLRDDPLAAERPGGLEPRGADAAGTDLRNALAALRDEPRFRADRAVLLACPVHNPYRATRDLPPLALAACTPLALYGDSRSEVTGSHPQFLPRLEELLRFFRQESDFDSTLFARLEHRGVRAVAVLVREEDVAFVPGLVAKLARLGFVRWRDFGTVALYVGPAAAAARYGAPSAR